MWTLFGLGNPGSDYEGTRHNVGYDVLDELAERHGIRFLGGGRQYVDGTGRIGDEAVRLVKPTAFMNRSGVAWRMLARQEELAPERAVVIYDDIHLPLGKLRLRMRGSDGGHNGLASILEAAGDRNVKRMRLGIGGNERDWVDHVLSPFTKAESEVVIQLVQLAADAAELMVGEDFEAAMNRFSGETV